MDYSHNSFAHWFHNIVVFTQLFFSPIAIPTVLTSKTTLAKQEGVTLLGYDWTPRESHKKFKEFCVKGMMGTPIKLMRCTYKCSLPTQKYTRNKRIMWCTDTRMQTDLPPLSWGKSPRCRVPGRPWHEGSKVKKFVFPGLPLIIYSWNWEEGRERLRKKEREREESPSVRPLMWKTKSPF